VCRFRSVHRAASVDDGPEDHGHDIKQGNHHEEDNHGNIWPGDLFGANPTMGSASYIECAVFRGAAMVWSDNAFAGDGTDVNCLRRAI
jgi:hypothetical protein